MDAAPGSNVKVGNVAPLRVVSGVMRSDVSSSSNTACTGGEGGREREGVKEGEGPTWPDPAPPAPSGRETDAAAATATA